MLLQAPKIDERSYDNIVGQTTALVQRYTDWRPAPVPDAGSALIGIFGHMVEAVIERLNQAPEKNFLAFLDLIGTQLMPPRAAWVPLTFALAAGRLADALVPARTQVAAPPEAAGEEDEVIFETDHDLVMTRAQLLTAFVHDPTADRYDDYPQQAPEAGETAFDAFRAAKAIEHSLYLECDDFFTLPEAKTVTLTIESATASALQALDIVWEYWDGTAWQRLSALSSVQGRTWQVTIAPMPVPVSTTRHGIQAGWIRARLAQSLPAPLPQITRITARVEITRTGLLPAQSFANGVLLDLHADFLPFGEQPRPNDALYLALPAMLADAARPTTVTVHVTLSTPQPIVPQDPDSTPHHPQVRWEVWSGERWQILEVAAASTPGAKDWLASGTVSITLPAELRLEQRRLNGEIGYWLRARLVSGNYGTPVTAAWNETTKKVELKGGYCPPSVASLTLDYTATWTGPVAACHTYNDFRSVDQTEAARAGGAPFAPFMPSAESRPALYLGFDRPFDNRPMTLYVHVEPPRPGEVAQAVPRATPVATPPQVVWEYASTEGWSPLNAADATNALANSGVIRFLGPADFIACDAWGQKQYWLRARWAAGTFLVPPRLRWVRTNTTWATQASTMQNEILGSSTGEAQQAFRTVQAPVLLGQRLEVQEPALLSTPEQAAFVALEGADAITVRRAEAGQIEAIWVRWDAVADFYGSGSMDRHYVLDHLTGDIRFGDGQHGMAPPAGRNNIRLALYRTSGGAQGNRPAETITQLKTALPYVAGVTNYEAAEGGADQETLAEARERGPKALRHRGRAATAQDMEDLAYEASPEVARARVLTPVFDPITLPWLPTYSLPMTQPGEITVEATWTGGQKLTFTIHGPGQDTPYAQCEDTSPCTLTYTVTPEQYQAGDVWRVTVVNRVDGRSTGQMTITYPGGGLRNVPLEVPAQAAHAPQRASRPGGQVEIVIVPRRPGPQPTPNLTLLTRVKEYILARSTPTLALQVTEPEWVQVTVTAAVVPVSLEVAETLRTTVVTALERFLHPLTGRWDGQGWPFGRRPHLSDLYTLLEAVPGVHHVPALSVVNVPSLSRIDPPRDDEVPEDDPTLEPLAPEQGDRFLIFSGQHIIRVVTSHDEIGD